jgi:hypothetical protein
MSFVIKGVVNFGGEVVNNIKENLCYTEAYSVAVCTTSKASFAV